MAKQTKSTSAPAPTAVPASTTAPEVPQTAKVPTTPKEPAKEHSTGADTDLFRRVLGADGKGAPGVIAGPDGKPVAKKVAPQAQVIANLIEAHVDGITRKDLLAKLPAAGLQTRQPVARILGYYQKDMVSWGLITVTHATPAPVVVAPAVAPAVA